MSYVLDESDFPVNGYNAKKIKNIIEPTDKPGVKKVGRFTVEVE